MAFSYQNLRSRLQAVGLFPGSRLALIAWYVFALDVLLFVLRKVFALFGLSWGEGLGGWIVFFGLTSLALFIIMALRWTKAKLLWRLRNRLIVTYVFIGVIPILLLAALGFGCFYLFAGQFATYIVTNGLTSELGKLDAANSSIAHQLAAQTEGGTAYEQAFLRHLQERNEHWANRQVFVWQDGKLLNPASSGKNISSAPPSILGSSFHEVVQDGSQLYLRAMETVSVGGKNLSVLSSEPFAEKLLQQLAANLGEITLYEGLSRKVESVAAGGSRQPPPGISIDTGHERYTLDTSKAVPALTAGSVPAPIRGLDPQVNFVTAIFVKSWQTGKDTDPAAISVQTRFSRLYEKLFAAQGDFAPLAEVTLVIAFIIFALSEIVAVIIGTRLTRTVTGAVGQLYAGTERINKGDFGHRVVVRSSDQIAALSNSFNSMTASLEELIEEQKAKQRLENELVIAQEVQAQLFPKETSQLATLEVHGFCRPARTVSGDYYDFLKVAPDSLVLAVGDISGKGISAALLMATIHSAVRAYSSQEIPALREPVSVGAAGNFSSNNWRETELSPALLLALLNDQLFDSTPPEKYATLFLGIYNERDRSLVYSNGGHLPPLLLRADGSIDRLETGGTVVGLFDRQSYQESSVGLRVGDIFLAYSDGVTEPENDFGEFGEQRLRDLIRENRDLPLERIREIITAAVDDWIGANEQPDDITLVLARAK